MAKIGYTSSILPGAGTLACAQTSIAMASRKEQKEQARARRLAEEQAQALQARRTRRLQMLGGMLVIVVAAVAVAIAVSSGGGRSNPGTPIRSSVKGVKLPAPKISNLSAAAAAAHCVVNNPNPTVADSPQNRTHVNPGTKVPYATNPPSYGPHYPSPAHDGEYKAGGVPAIGYLVHAMEHGRVEYQYKPGLPQTEVRQLEALFGEQDGPWAPGQLLLLFPNPTGMPYQVAVTAWGHMIGCPKFSPRVFDVLRDFRLAYTDRAPENLGTGPE